MKTFGTVDPEFDQEQKGIISYLSVRHKSAHKCAYQRLWLDSKDHNLSLYETLVF